MADGSNQSLGQWKKRDAAEPVAVGSNAYATALIAFAALQAGVQPSQPNLSKALAWLRTHQDPHGGFWTAESMNHKHSTHGVMAEKFMSDAATGYATAALLAAGDEGIQRTASSSKPRN